MTKFATPGADAFLSGTPLPSTLYVQFHTGDPGTNGTSNIATETDRMQVDSWTAPASGGAGYRAIQNNTDEQILGVAGAETYTHITLWSASSGGTCWFICNSTDIIVDVGNTVQATAGSIIIRIVIW